MKRALIHIITILAVAGMLAGCTHNNGDIGAFFGTWHLDDITISCDNGDDHSYTVLAVDSTFWAFQSSVIMMERLKPEHSADKRYGTWSHNDELECISLDFTHHDDNHPQGSQKYSMLEGLFLPADGRVTLHIKKMTKVSMVLYYVDTAESKTYTYYFTKW